MDKQAPILQSQEVREMFHARFDGCCRTCLFSLVVD